MQNNEVILILTPYTKINFKWIKVYILGPFTSEVHELSLDETYVALLFDSVISWSLVNSLYQAQSRSSNWN